MTITSDMYAQDTSNISSTAPTTKGTSATRKYSEWMTYSEMKRHQNKFLDFSDKPKWSYATGIELEAMYDTYLRYGDPTILDFCEGYVNSLVCDDGSIRGYRLNDFNLDNLRPGHLLTKMHKETPREKTRIAIMTLLEQTDNQPRTKTDSVYWHKAIYAYQVWLDGIFMGLPFRVQSTNSFRDKETRLRVYDDAVRQVTKTYQRTYDKRTGLNRHAYDENRNMFWADTASGQSLHCWGRAQGWFCMALIEILDAMPENYDGRKQIIKTLRKCLNNVIRWQDRDSGLWWQVTDCPNKEGNYLESTCSSMFAYTLLKAYNKGYVGRKYRDAGVKAYEGITREFIRHDADGTISLTRCCAVAGLGPGRSDEVDEALLKTGSKKPLRENRKRDGSFNYYINETIRDNDPKGIGPFIWASLEMERLNK